MDSYKNNVLQSQFTTLTNYKRVQEKKVACYQHYGLCPQNGGKNVTWTFTTVTTFPFSFENTTQHDLEWAITFFFFFFFLRGRMGHNFWQSDSNSFIHHFLIEWITYTNSHVVINIRVVLTLSILNLDRNSVQ